MNFQPHHIYHVYNQGNNKQLLFHDEEDYICFLRLTRNTLFISANILAYCLMPNHFHFMIESDERCDQAIKQGNLTLDPITNSFRKLLSSYSRLYNQKYQRSGSLFRQKTKANQLSLDKNISACKQDYYLNCFHYIHQNPLRAGLVSKLEEWEFSSFKDYAELRNGTLINKSLSTRICGYNIHSFYKESYQILNSWSDRDGQTM